MLYTRFLIFSSSGLPSRFIKTSVSAIIETHNASRSAGNELLAIFGSKKIEKKILKKNEKKNRIERIIICVYLNVWFTKVHLKLFKFEVSCFDTRCYNKCRPLQREIISNRKPFSSGCTRKWLKYVFDIFSFAHVVRSWKKNYKCKLKLLKKITKKNLHGAIIRSRIFGI